MNNSLNHLLKRFVQTCRFNQKLSMQISESLNHSLIQFVQTHGFIQKRTTRSLNERVTESFTQTIHSNTQIQSETKHANKRVIDSFTHTIHSNTRIYSETNHADLFKNEPRKVLISESLNHSLIRFVQTRGSIQK